MLAPIMKNFNYGICCYSYFPKFSRGQINLTGGKGIVHHVGRGACSSKKFRVANAPYNISPITKRYVQEDSFVSCMNIGLSNFGGAHFPSACKKSLEISLL